jgi:hypothetical protein
MSARPGPCGGQPATAVPTAIVNQASPVCKFMPIGRAYLRSPFFATPLQVVEYKL